MPYRCENLKLVPLTLPELLLFHNEPAAFIKHFGLANTTLYNPDFLRELNEEFILPRLQTVTEKDLVFATKWVAIEAESNMAVADLVIKNGPDENGGIEIGYTTYPEFRRQGFMTGIIYCFLKWAKTEPRIKKIVAETEKTNLASIKVLQCNHFQLTSEKGACYYWLALV